MMVRARGTFRAACLAAAIVAVCASAPGAALASGANANLRRSPPPSGEFTVAGSNGYSVTVKSEKGLVTLTVSRGRSATTTIAPDGRLVAGEKGSYSESVYAVRGSPRDPDKIEADLGRLGRISVDFQPSGRERVTTVDLAEKTERCVGATKITRRLGTFTGTISFSGENGYTSVEQTSAPGTVGTSPFRNCRTRVRHRAEPGPETARVPRVAALSIHGGDGAPSFLAFGDHRSAHFNALSGELVDGLVSVLRIAHASSAGTGFAFDDAGTRATLKPPAPFSGSATFRDGIQGPPVWSGDLGVEFPGFLMPLTGVGFDSPNLALFRDPAASAPRRSPYRLAPWTLP